MSVSAHPAGRTLDPRDVLLAGRGSRWALAALAAAAPGWLAVAAFVVRGGADRERFFRSYLVSFSFFLSLALGGLFFVLVTHLTRAAWSVVLRRVAEAVSLTLPLLFPLALVIYLGRAELYEWARPAAVRADELLQHKEAYLNAPFFLLRLLFYFVVWSALSVYFARVSMRQDSSGGAEPTQRLERLAAPGMIFYAMTLTFASFDLLMSLYPHWYSTIFGVYYFAGSALALFALVTLLALGLKRAGKLTGWVTVDHYHDLGKLMFAFVVFWAYIAFSQYMLIWIAGIPEETVWYLVRQEGPWKALSLLLLFGHFFVPFLWLMSRHVKRRLGVLATAAIWLLAMHWLDLYWLVMPEASPHASPFHLLDLACLLALGGPFFAVVFAILSRVPLVPLRDPRLRESLESESV